MLSHVTSELWRTEFEASLLSIQDELYPEQQRLHSACRYALAGKGKRIRPLLCFAASEACGGSWREAMPAALALEFIHTYSLVHDDLPDLDNDDWRRGRLTTHRVFDIPTALLAGDSLLTDAFQILSQNPPIHGQERLAMVQVLSQAAGGRGMVLGQDFDLHWTGRSGYQRSDLDRIHTHKTGALIAAACVMGGLSASANKQQLGDLQSFGAAIGLAFQIIDDLLDSSLATGKSSGKDRSAGKLTYLSLMNHDEASRLSAELTDKALQLAAGFGPRGTGLAQLAQDMLKRQH